MFDAFSNAGHPNRARYRLHVRAVDRLDHRFHAKLSDAPRKQYDTGGNAHKTLFELYEQERFAARWDFVSTVGRDKEVICVHVGDVMVKGGDLFGDGINIAARLQTVASPGGVCLQGIAAELNRRRIPTASGQGRWQAVQVRRVLARL